MPVSKSGVPHGTLATTAMMALDVTLELSVEELISALNKKMFMEYTRVRSAMPPVSRTLVATLATEVWSGG